MLCTIVKTLDEKGMPTEEFAPRKPIMREKLDAMRRPAFVPDLEHHEVEGWVAFFFAESECPNGPELVAETEDEGWERLAKLRMEADPEEYANLEEAVEDCKRSYCAMPCALRVAVVNNLDDAKPTTLWLHDSSVEE